MTTYNGEAYIKQQLESILLQLPGSSTDGSLAEVIVADDGSTDETLKVIGNFNDCRIKVLPQGDHLGPVYNFERALRAATGDVIFLSDQDDVWMPHKVEAILDALKFDGSTDSSVAPLLAVHDASFIDGNGRPLFSSAAGVAGDSVVAADPAERSASDLTKGASAEFVTALSATAEQTMWTKRSYKQGVFRNWLKNSYTGCCMAFRRELLQRALPFPKNLPMHDQWLGLVAERLFGSKSVVAVPQPLIQYRVHQKNATHLLHSEGGRRPNAGRRIKWRIDLLKALLTLR